MMHLCSLDDGACIVIYCSYSSELAACSQHSRRTMLLRLESLRRKFFHFEDYLFEKRYGYELECIVKKKDLVVLNKRNLLRASAYQAVRCQTLRELFCEAQKTGCSFESFIDIEAGK
jgi:hypothetical protein